jgi:hypothetical protein
MESHISQVEEWIQAMLTLKQSLIELEIAENEIAPFLQRWHFTASQKCQLQSLLRRWKACTGMPVSWL